MTLSYTLYRLNKSGAIVESKAVTSAADVDAFERARAALLGERQQMLSEICAPASAEMEDAA